MGKYLNTKCKVRRLKANPDKLRSMLAIRWHRDQEEFEWVTLARKMKKPKEGRCLKEQVGRAQKIRSWRKVRTVSKRLQIKKLSSLQLKSMKILSRLTSASKVTITFNAWLTTSIRSSIWFRSHPILLCSSVRRTILSKSLWWNNWREDTCRK